MSPVLSIVKVLGSALFILAEVAKTLDTEGSLRDCADYKEVSLAIGGHGIILSRNEATGYRRSRKEQRHIRTGRSGKGGGQQ